MKKSNLRKQLRKTGANQHEAESLANLASALANIKIKGLSDKAKQEIISNIGKKPRFVHPLRWATGGLVTAVLAVVVVTVVIQPNKEPIDINRENEQVESMDQALQEEKLIIEQMEKVETLKKEKAPEEEIKDAEVKYESSVRDLWQRNNDDSEQDYLEWWQNRYQQLNRGVNSWSDGADDVEQNKKDLL